MSVVPFQALSESEIIDQFISSEIDPSIFSQLIGPSSEMTENISLLLSSVARSIMIENINLNDAIIMAQNLIRRFGIRGRGTATAITNLANNLMVASQLPEAIRFGIVQAVRSRPGVINYLATSFPMIDMMVRNNARAPYNVYARHPYLSTAVASLVASYTGSYVKSTIQSFYNSVSDNLSDLILIENEKEENKQIELNIANYKKANPPQSIQSVQFPVKPRSEFPFVSMGNMTKGTPSMQQRDVQAQPIFTIAGERAGQTMTNPPFMPSMTHNPPPGPPPGPPTAPPGPGQSTAMADAGLLSDILKQAEQEGKFAGVIIKNRVKARLKTMESFISKMSSDKKIKKMTPSEAAKLIFSMKDDVKYINQLKRAYNKLGKGEKGSGNIGAINEFLKKVEKLKQQATMQASESVSEAGIEQPSTSGTPAMASTSGTPAIATSSGTSEMPSINIAEPGPLEENQANQSAFHFMEMENSPQSYNPEDQKKITKKFAEYIIGYVDRRTLEKKINFSNNISQMVDLPPYIHGQVLYGINTPTNFI